MGNLVFKPATGGGNKVIFQNQGGSDALTVDDSGAIAIAGNTTLSGTANNIGTVTAGTISGGTLTSGVTYPAGHVLQVKNICKTAAQTITDTNAEILQVAFNRIVGNSHFICMGHVALAPVDGSANQDSANPKLWWKLNGTIESQSTRLSDNGFYHSDVPMWHNGSNYNGAYDSHFIHSHVTMTLSGSANDSVTIAIQGKSSAYGMYVNRCRADTASGGFSSITVMEIQ